MGGARRSTSPARLGTFLRSGNLEAGCKEKPVWMALGFKIVVKSVEGAALVAAKERSVALE